MFPVILRREIIILLAVKVALLAVLYLLFFSPGDRLALSPQHMRSHLLEDG